MNHPGIYFQADATSVTIVGGSYNPEKDQLEKIRKAIVKDPARVNKILAGKKFTELFPQIGEDKYKVLPAEYKAAAEKAPVLYNKSFHYEKEYKGQTFVTRKDLAQFIVDHYKAASEWNKFLEEALGK